MPSTSFRLPACLAIVLAAACAAPAVPAATTPRGISGEIREDMDQARREMRADLAAARAELVQGNLELGQSPAVARRKAPAADAPPKGEITPARDLLVDGRAVPDGPGPRRQPHAYRAPVAALDLLVDGRAVPVDPGQRRQLQAYRAQVVELALLGIDAGEQAAEAAIDAVDHGLFRLLFDAATGRLERRVERTVKRTLAPQIERICHRLPDLLESQRRLADSVPEFRPYATLDPGDVDECAREVRRGLARDGVRRTRRADTG